MECGSVIYNILSKLSSCIYLLLSDVIAGFLREEIDLENYVLLLGKVYLWDRRRNDNKPSIMYFMQILKNKYDTEKLIPCLKSPVSMGESSLRGSMDVVLRTPLF